MKSNKARLALVILLVLVIGIGTAHAAWGLNRQAACSAEMTDRYNNMMELMILTQTASDQLHHILIKLIDAEGR